MCCRLVPDPPVRAVFVSCSLITSCPLSKGYSSLTPTSFSSSIRYWSYLFPFKMSFGWSAGDVVSMLQFTNKIISSLRSATGSRAHFQELEVELQGLQRALLDISELTGSAEQIPECTQVCFLCLWGDVTEVLQKDQPVRRELGWCFHKGKAQGCS